MTFILIILFSVKPDVLCMVDDQCINVMAPTILEMRLLKLG